MNWRLGAAGEPEEAFFRVRIQMQNDLLTAAENDKLDCELPYWNRKWDGVLPRAARPGSRAAKEGIRSASFSSCRCITGLLLFEVKVLSGLAGGRLPAGGGPVDQPAGGALDTLQDRRPLA